MPYTDTDGRLGHAIPSIAEFPLALVFVSARHRPHGIQARRFALAL